MDYKNAGVDIEAGYRSVELMKKHIAKTMRPEVLGGIGGFSGAFSMKAFKDMEEPTLVSGTDGCGTKVKLAMVMDKHDTIGIDAVAMCVNDIACAGGEPLFFLDYIACGKNYPEKIAEIVGGVAEGCLQSGAALIGGETAEHPGLMEEDEYDLAGFAVGIIDKKDLITGAEVTPGDVLIGIASSGVHSNGFSLVRKVFEMTKESLDTYYEELGNDSRRGASGSHPHLCKSAEERKRRRRPYPRLQPYHRRRILRECSPYAPGGNQGCDREEQLSGTAHFPSDGREREHRGTDDV